MKQIHPASVQGLNALVEVNEPVYGTWSQVGLSSQRTTGDEAKIIYWSEKGLEVLAVTSSLL